MNPIILVILLAGGGADSVSMQRFETAESCEAAGQWVTTEHYASTARGSTVSVAWRCFRGDWKPEKKQ